MPATRAHYNAMAQRATSEMCLHCLAQGEKAGGGAVAGNFYLPPLHNNAVHKQHQQVNSYAQMVGREREGGPGRGSKAIKDL